MTAYLFSSILISLAGLAYYLLFIRAKASYAVSRLSIYLIIGLSLALPYIGKKLLEKPSVNNSHYLVSALTHQQSCSHDDIVAECERIWADGGECNTEVIKQQNIVAYQANNFYDFLLNYHQPARTGFVVLAALFGGLLVLRISWLSYLLLVGKREQALIDGMKCTVLKAGNAPTGSFRLFNNYIVWNKRFDELKPEEKEAILLHEVSHLRQLNTWELIGMGLLQVFWFVNPVFYLLKRELVAISEFIADEFVLQRTGDRKWYATLLLKLQTQNQFALVQSFSQGHLKSRIKNIVQEKPKPSKGRSWFALTHLILALVMVAGLSISMMQQQNTAIVEYQQVKEEYQASRMVACPRCPKPGTATAEQL